MLGRILPSSALALVACAAAPPPPSVSARDPSNPRAEETPVALVAAAPSPAAAPDAGPTIFACPMHPDVTATEAGHRCPKCGMELVPRRNAP